MLADKTPYSALQNRRTQKGKESDGQVQVLRRVISSYAVLPLRLCWHVQGTCSLQAVLAEHSQAPRKQHCWTLEWLLRRTLHNCISQPAPKSQAATNSLRHGILGTSASR